MLISQYFYKFSKNNYYRKQASGIACKNIQQNAEICESFCKTLIYWIPYEHTT